MDCPGKYSGGELHLWTFHGGFNQTFVCNNDGTIENPETGLVLHVEGNAHANGTKITLSRRRTPVAPHQLFRYDANGCIVHVSSGKCLDVDRGNDAKRAKVHLWSLNGGNNQRWDLVKNDGDEQ